MMQNDGSSRAINGHRSEVAIGDGVSHGNVLALGGVLSLGMLHSGGLVRMVVAGHARVGELARAAECQGLGIGCNSLAHAALAGQLVTIHGDLGAWRADSSVGHSKAEDSKAEHICSGNELRCA